MSEQPKKDAPQGYEAEWQEAVRQGAPKIAVMRTMVPVTFGGLTDDKVIAGTHCEMRDFRGQWLVRHRPPSPVDAKWTVYKVGAGNQRQAQ